MPSFTAASTHENTSPLEFNNDETYSKLVKEAVEMKVLALGGGAVKPRLLAEWFSSAAHKSVEGMEACVKVVGPKLFAGRGQVDRTGTTPLLAACRAGSFDVCDALVREKADVRAADAHGATPLLLACMAGSAEICVMLIKAKADVSAADDAGTTPLIAASALQSLGICMALLEAKADVSAADADGTTALLLATKAGSFELFDALISARLLQAAHAAAPAPPATD